MRRYWILLTLVGALLVPGIRAVQAGQRRPSPTVSYVVHAGDTLWTIAGNRWPDEDRRKGVHRLLELNELSSPSLIPGQKIVLPAR
jgi:LysM repeat protein